MNDEVILEDAALQHETMLIRPAISADAEKLLEIYAPYVVSEDTSKSNASFELEVPSVAEFAGRIKEISRKFPYLVAENDGEILGYVYCHPYRERLAYQWSVEVTIYMAEKCMGKGLGRLLYETMEKILCLQGVTMAYSCITLGNEGSIKMHAALGYRLIGTFSNSGYKNNMWLDTVWMEKQLQECPAWPEPIKSWRELPPEDICALLVEATQKMRLLKL